MTPEQSEAAYWEAYQKKSYEERIRHWSGMLHRDMRWQVESGLDPYIVFSREWLLQVQKREARIFDILEACCETTWKGYWDTKEIRRRMYEEGEC